MIVYIIYDKFIFKKFKKEADGMIKEQISIEIIDKDGNIRERDENSGHCEIVWYGSYEPGDVIKVTAKQDSFVRIQTDQLLYPASVYLKKGSFSFPVPFGRAKEAYPQEAFTGIIHQLSAMYTEKEGGHKLLSENPLDVREETGVYPHCTATVETRGESVFAARNTIDGLFITPGHGFYPYTSWGCGMDPDAHIDIFFGREVLADEIHIFLRSDFPHDNHWVSGILSFSDESFMEIQFEKTGKCQVFRPKAPVRTEWVRLGALKKDPSDPSPFPALTQWRVFGREL
ncbi:MAG TPA: carbohydrate-binding protein [Lachnospiraceae bacterium]|nr:carbohydrate-binding protein [Lachnospiraceae bacterium]